jgi:hypothetical protein
VVLRKQLTVLSFGAVEILRLAALAQDEACTLGQVSVTRKVASITSLRH